MAGTTTNFSSYSLKIKGRRWFDKEEGGGQSSVSKEFEVEVESNKEFVMMTANLTIPRLHPLSA
ncbi:hypothetical protein FRX31_032873 [Thalictrum thalictroides]|uniref:Uncharacterized protein n=1 Tax=Thalictrum thalictroides TaxID=46969 RepID=A0A7J6UZP1_THATH|nr:hypothetical protein FRX31_032873 [Thalictrum thalictroides]